MEFVEAVLLTVITASTPLLLAASGELVVERAGVLNLGVEGMMIVGAACGFAGAYLTGSIAVGALCGILRRHGALGGLRRADARACGQPGRVRARAHHPRRRPRGLIGAGYVGQKIDGAAHLYIPYITDIPFLGRVLLRAERLRLFLGSR
jgi:simple sugar transport system permease protein